MEQIINNPLVACVISLSVLVIALMFIAINLYVKIANINVEINNLTNANQDRIRDLSDIRREQTTYDNKFRDVNSRITSINKILSEPLYSVGDVVECKYFNDIVKAQIIEVASSFSNSYETISNPRYKVELVEYPGNPFNIFQSDITAHY